MNKLLKLPIFLGVVGGLCAAILAGIDAITSPIITKNDETKIAENYKSIFTNIAEYQDVTIDDITTISSNDGTNFSDELYNGGCTGMCLVEKYQGAVYSFEVTGFAGKFKFQVGFAEGKYIGYADISNSESNQGASLIAGLKKPGKESSIYGIDASTNMLNGNYLNVDANCGSSKTGAPIANACNIAAADYANRYQGGGN